MIYDLKNDRGAGWVLGEKDALNEETLAKYESVMCQGNGYMCLRAAAEEKASDKIGRYTLVAGTFDHFPGYACNELPNLPDTTEQRITVNETPVTAAAADKDTYLRTLDLATGLLHRTFCQKVEKGSVKVDFYRAVSLADKHIAAMKTVIAPSAAATVHIETGISGQVPRGEHMIAGERSVDGGIMQLVTRSVQSGILFIVSTELDFFIESSEGITKASPCTTFNLTGDRTLTESADICVPTGAKLIIEKKVSVFTTRDRGLEMFGTAELLRHGRTHLSENATKNFDVILEESARQWNKRIWSCRDVVIDGNDRDQLAIHFALYHLTCMAPVHDNRMNIGAKGLSGPGYYGHAFWDTEIYMLPYFIFEAPDEARSLVEYRYNCLPASRRIAKKTHCDGARFPWEASWITDEESTPIWCDTGEYELHITADVAFGAYYYYTVSGDEDFMRRGGYELILDCARFWASRLEYNEKLDRYEITDVIGPNEYKVHVNNSAYTNHMAHFNMTLAMEYARKLRTDDPELYASLNEKLKLDENLPSWKEKADKLYLPKENSDGIIPEDDVFLSLPTVIENGVSISRDPGARQRALDIGFPYCMIDKQADVVALMYMLEDLFTPESKRQNFYFYERCCFHDSSLSLSTFSALAADLGEKEMAYSLFERATMIDICDDNPDSSNGGVHAASLGGMWQCCVLGFGGVRRYGDELRIQPHLPEEWKSVSFEISWHGQRLHITADHTDLTVENLTKNGKVEFLCGGKIHSLTDKIRIAY